VFSRISGDSNRFWAHFVPASEPRVARKIGRLNAGVRILELGFFEQISRIKTPTPLLERGAGKSRWSWEDETSDPRRENKCALCGIQAAP
jgi:hypothetical protein